MKEKEDDGLLLVYYSQQPQMAALQEVYFTGSHATSSTLRRDCACDLKIHIRTHNDERPYKCYYSGVIIMLQEVGNVVEGWRLTVAPARVKLLKSSIV